MKKFTFSFSGILATLQATMLRFPLASFAALCAFGVASYLIHAEEPPAEFLFVRIFITLFALFWLSLSLDLWHRARGSKAVVILATRAALIVLAVVYFLLLPATEDAFFGAHGWRHFMWHIGVLLTVTFAPFLWTQFAYSHHAFYGYLRHVVLRVIVSGIFAIGIFLLGALVLWSLDVLFGFDVSGEVFLQWWAVAALLVAPLFFLARMRTAGESEGDHACPPDVKYGVQYALIPFVVIAFLILYAYTLRILLTWTWPEGELSWLIISFSIIGWITYIHARAYADTSKVFTLFTRLFPYVAVPQVVMLFLALWWRIDAYGVTINRYLVAAFGVWLLLTGLYYSINKKQTLLWLPLSFFVAIFATSFGPWGAFSVAERSQVARLEALVQEHGIVQEGRIVNVSEQLSREQEDNIASVIEYLGELHGTQALEMLFPEDVAAIQEEYVPLYAGDSISHWGITGRLKERMGVQRSYYGFYDEDEDGTRFSFHATSAARKALVPVDQYTYVVETLTHSQRLMSDLSSQGHDYALYLAEENDAIVLKEHTSGKEVDRISMKEYLFALSKKEQIELSQDQLTFTGESDRFVIKLVIDDIDGLISTDGTSIEMVAFDGLLLLSVR